MRRKFHGLRVSVLSLVAGVVVVSGDPAAAGISAAQASRAYDRGTNVFAEAMFFKPREESSEELGLKLAPLLIHARQPATGAATEVRCEEFGALYETNGQMRVDWARPTIYAGIDTFANDVNLHLRATFLWFYARAGEDARLASVPQPRLSDTNSAPVAGGTPGDKERPGVAAGVTRPLREGIFAQGIRITLNSAGEPVIWEVLSGEEGLQEVYVAQSLEAAAAAEFGKPLPGRRFAIERNLEEAPNTVVPRVIDDGPVPMGPMVYLSAGTPQISTVICRCMPAQVKTLSATRSYELTGLEGSLSESLLHRARTEAGMDAAFWPGQPQTNRRLDKVLRLPKVF